MIDIVSDIETLEDVIDALETGTGADQRVALNTLVTLMETKQQQLQEFEDEFCTEQNRVHAT